MFRWRALVVALSLALWMIGGHAFGQQVHGDSKNTWLKDKHDPCIIKHDGMFYMFASGEGCPMATSPDLLVWQDRGTAFKTFPKWASAVTQGRDTRIWAPDICYFGGRYRLYYSVSQVGVNRSAIGFASNECLDPLNDKYQWIDHGKPVIESFPTRDTFNAIDPNVVLDEYNQPFLSFGSYWGGIMMCRLDPATGCPANTNAFTTLASRPRPEDPIEAPFIIRRNNFYYLFMSFGRCDRGAESDYHIVCGRASKPEGPYLDRQGRPLRDGNATVVLKGYDRFRGPGHNAALVSGSSSIIVHSFFDSVSRTPAELQVRSLLWGPDGWPLPGKPYSASAARQRVEGKWDHTVDFGEPTQIAIRPNGIVENPSGKWSLAGDVLVMRWPRSGGGEWIDECVVDRSGEWYSGRNQNDLVIFGQHK
jgi:arabinan endo-1,5-alpha-L-arabinosidase